MAVYEPVKDIYVAAERWRDECLLGERSILSDERLWNRKGFEDLVEHYVNNPDEGEDSFFVKLQRQLEPAPKSAVKLLGEVFWALYLYVSRTGMTQDTKRRQIKRIWEWSGEEFPEKGEQQLAYFDDGIGHPGTGFFTHRWLELRWFILAMHEWFGKSVQDRKTVLSQPWGFADWLEATPKSHGRQFRHILLHLLFPAEFERVSTGSHKRQILAKLGATAEGASVDYDPADRVSVDKALFALRGKLEQQHGSDVDFYKAEIWQKWAQPSQTTPQSTTEKPSDAESGTWYQLRFGSSRVWMISPGPGGQLWAEFKRQNLIAIGWDFLGDLLEYSSKEEIEASVRTASETEKRRWNDALACYEFSHVMKPGDTVIADHRKSYLRAQVRNTGRERDCAKTR